MGVPCVVLGSGNIGTDLMYKLLRSDALDVEAVVGVDPESDGLARARVEGLETSTDGVAWIVAHATRFHLVFDATSAPAHVASAPRLRDAGLRGVDLTPAKLGPGVVPVVNLDAHLDAPDVNLISCGGQATIPIVAAVASVVGVPYAEIVSTVASKSAGPGTRQNIDEFTRTTARGLEEVGGAARGKAIIVLNPAEPPLIMRDTVLCLINADDLATHEQIRESVAEMVAVVAGYVPGYRLKQEVQITPMPKDQPVHTLTGGLPVTHQVSVFLEVEGAAHYLPSYAGNLDIMTSAALAAAERMARA